MLFEFILLLCHKLHVLIILFCHSIIALHILHGNIGIHSWCSFTVPDFYIISCPMSRYSGSQAGNFPLIRNCHSCIRYNSFQVLVPHIYVLLLAAQLVCFLLNLPDVACYFFSLFLVLFYINFWIITFHRTVIPESFNNLVDSVGNASLQTVHQSIL